MYFVYNTEKNGLVGLNSNFENDDESEFSQIYLFKSTGILVEIIRILIDIIILVNIKILIDFPRNVISTPEFRLFQLKF